MDMPMNNIKPKERSERVKNIYNILLNPIKNFYFIDKKP